MIYTLAVTLIDIPAWGNTNLVEAIWLASGLFALICTLLHIKPLHKDWYVAAELNRPVLMAVAWGYLRREIVRTVQAACLCAIGAYAATQPSARPGHDSITVVGLVLTAVLMTLGFLVGLQSFWDWGTRKHVQQLIERGVNGPSLPPTYFPPN